MPERLNLYVGPEIHKKLRILAAERETSINAIVVEFIKEGLEKNKKEEGGKDEEK